MKKEQKEIDSLIGEISEKWVERNIKKKNDLFFEIDKSSFNGLHFMSAFLLTFLGTSVVALSVIELIHPVWLATIMTVVGSISIITGLVLFYSLFVSSDSFNSLINKAIKRVILFQN